MLESSSADDIPPPSVLKLPADLIKKMSWPLLKTLLHGFQTIIESYVHITQDYTKNMVWKKLLKVIKLCSVHHKKTFLVPKKQERKKKYSERNELIMWSHVNSTGKSNVHPSPPWHLTKPQITWRGHTKEIYHHMTSEMYFSEGAAPLTPPFVFLQWSSCIISLSRALNRGPPCNQNVVILTLYLHLI